MDDYYQEEVAENVVEPHEDHDLFEQVVIGENEELWLVHHLLSEVLRKKKS